MSILSLATTTCDILGALITQDAMGAIKHTWVMSYPAVPCRIRYLTGKEIVQIGKTQNIPTHRIYMENKYVIDENNMLVDKTTNDTYDIVEVNPYYRTHIQIDARKVTSVVSNTGTETDIDGGTANTTFTNSLNGGHA